jgi:Fur family transcriptional regulator, ferric uptake regulator
MIKRKTIQRGAIRQILEQSKGPLGVKEVLEAARGFLPGLNQSTVYRNLKVLVEEGRLLKLNHPTLGTLYERAGRVHHHHFYCRICDRVIELQGCGLDESRGMPVGFVAESHEVFLFGVCSSCTP